MHLKLLVLCIFAMVFVNSAPVDSVPDTEPQEAFQLQEKGALITPEETIQMLQNKYLTPDGRDLIKSLLSLPTGFRAGKK